MNRWSVEQVAAVAPSKGAMSAAETAVDPSRWSMLGGDDRGVWGRCRGSGSEPYETMVDHVQAAWRCTCPSRKLPCKHALALLLLWVRGDVPDASATSAVTGWITSRDVKARGDRNAVGGADAMAPAKVSEPATGDRVISEREEPDAADALDRDGIDRARDERVARMKAGLVELDRWLADRMRNGLADPALARYDTWDALAARLVDAQAGSLANRVRRMAGMVGASPRWHSEILAEIGLMHLLAEAGTRLPELDGQLADAVAVTTGWQVRRADVLAGVPDTDEWLVAGRSDQREDRIVVRRHWLYGMTTKRWAMLLSFAAYQQSLDDSLTVGTIVSADLHRYPGPAIRALIGRSDSPRPTTAFPTLTIEQACVDIGYAVAAEPWLERRAVIALGTPTVSDRHWVFTDNVAAVPLLGTTSAIATLVAASAGQPVSVTLEWTPHGVIPLAVALADRVLDIGPTADPSFVTSGAA